MSAKTASPSFLDPVALMRIRSLELRAKTVMEGLWKGLHRSPFHGFSVEFSEYRPYVRGDEPRHIDWKLAARSERYYVKKFEDETNLRCQMVVDGSSSMRYASGEVRKCDYAATLAATLASFLMKQGDAVGVTIFDAGVVEHVPPRNRPGHLRRLMHELEKPIPGSHSTALDVSMDQVADLLRKKGMVCVFSDLLAPIDKLKSQLASMGTIGHDVILFHILDRREIDFKFDDNALFEDLESGGKRFVNPKAAREGYLERFQAHCAAVRLACDQAGVEYCWCPTDLPLDAALFEFLSRRENLKKAGGRSRSSAAGGGA